MHLVYPYRNDPNSGLELRFSIRSMVKHFEDLTGVCVIGDKPSWFTGEYLQAVDITNRKEYSIVSKVIRSPYETFLLCSDDVYALKDFDVSLPYYYSGLLKDITRHGKVQDRLDNTRRLYPNGKMFDIHTPMVIDREQFREAHNLGWVNKEYLTKSIYCNYLGVEGVQIPDAKIRAGTKIPDAPFFSTNDRTARSVKFEEMYPEKSKFEI